MSRGTSAFRPTAAVALVGVLVTVLLARLVMVQLDASAQERLERRASLVTQAVQSEVDRYEDALALVAASAGSTPDLTQEQFDASVAPLERMGLAGATSIVFLAPPVPDEGIGDLQRYWRARGATGLTLTPGAEPRSHVFSIMSHPLDG